MLSVSGGQPSLAIFQKTKTELAFMANATARECRAQARLFSYKTFLVQQLNGIKIANVFDYSKKSRITCVSTRRER